MVSRGGVMRTGDDERDSQIQREFYIWEMDPESGLAISEIYCGSASAVGVAELLIISLPNLCAGNTIYIDEEAIQKISDFFSISLEFRSTAEIALCSWSPLDGLPYRLHARRELVLMVSGRKPLCSLIGSIPPQDSFEEIPEYLFDPYVVSGKLVKREYCEINSFKSSPYKGLRVVLYALMGEAWRLDAYIQVRLAATKLGWDESLTYLEGSLLGYSEPENDAFIEAARRPRK
jgi:hypothetical protein